MMKKIYSLIVSLFCCIAAVAQTTSAILKDPAARQRAVQVAASIVGDSNGNYDYYIGTTLWPNDTELGFGNPGVVQRATDCWLVFVDEAPGTGWEHQCRYVYVKAKSWSNPADAKAVVKQLPPSNISLEPIKVANRYGTRAKVKPMVPKIETNDPNLAAGHTYAVILNGGLNQTANAERYWNDCSFFYKTLRNRYGIPKQNIKVIMADGTSAAPDMFLADGSGYASSPLDLDGDGTADIEYPATKDAVRDVLNGMAQKLTDDDHLLLFVTGHGGYDNSGNRSYIYLWGGDKLFPTELNTWLGNINAGFISAVMGQCNAGGFVKGLEKTNRIIATACKEDEFSFSREDMPYNDFMYGWTSAINGYDAGGNKVNVKENISLLEAWRYASEKDIHANGGTRYGQETPMVNYFTHSVAYDLSLANIPPVVDLCFDDYSEPLVSWQRTKEYEKQTGLATRLDEEDNNNRRGFRFWNSPYIWLRNQDDGREVQKTERAIIDRFGKEIYVYTKVRNKGVKDYIYANDKMTVVGYWAESSTAISESVWKNISDPDYFYDVDDEETMAGGSIGTSSIRDGISAGGYSIVTLVKSFVNDDYYAMTSKPNTNLCVLAFLKGSGSKETFPVDSNKIAAVWKTDKLAQSNVMPIPLAKYADSLFVKVPNISITTRDMTIKVMKSSESEPVFSEANVSLELSSGLVDSWKNGGSLCNEVDVDKNIKGAFRLKSGDSQLKKLVMKPRQVGNIGLRCNFFADKEITEQKEYDIDIALIDNATGQCLGGETFRVVQEPRPAIKPLVESAVQNGKVVLEATNVNESVMYYWYDASGKLVGTGKTFNVPAGHQASEYTVHVEAVSDGAISYSAATLDMQHSSIQSVDSKSNPNVVKVTLDGPAANDATLRLASSTGNTPVSDHKVESGATTCTIPAGTMPSGVYQVTLIENGTVTGTKKFTK